MNERTAASANTDNRTTSESLKKVKLGKYRHYKSGDLYEVIGTAINRETMEELVIYKALHASEKSEKGQMWARPKTIFLETVEHNGVVVSRFQLVEEEYTPSPINSF